MSDWPVGISTGSFYKQSFFDCIDDIVEAGFSMLEICSSPFHLDYHDMDAIARAARMLSELGIEAYSFHAPFADDIDITAPDPAVRQRAENEMKQAARAAAALRVRHFVVHPGPEKARAPEPTERMTRLLNGASILQRVAVLCHDVGVGFVLENMLPHLMFGNLPDMLWMMGALTEMRVGTCLD
ncbi:MAG: TIM barrel protein, partial [Chitinivibrionales bacterium]|nr:TIM barrel protein [Chitinivibrionales bacterium]